MADCYSERLRKCDTSHQIKAIENLGKRETSPIVLFVDDGLHAVGGTDQRHVGAAVGEQPDGHHARNTVNGVFQRDSVKNFRPCTSRITLPLSVTTP